MKNGFSKSDIQRRIDEVRVSVMEQMKKNMDNYVWTHIKSLDELEEVRMSAMRMFYLTMSLERKRIDIFVMNYRKNCHIRIKHLILV